MHSVCQRAHRQNRGYSALFEQMETAAPSWPVKHNWRYIARETPPKRAASERACDFDEIYDLFDEATAREQASRCINCSDPGCVTNGCPLAIGFPSGSRLPPMVGSSKPQRCRVRPATYRKFAVAYVRRTACARARTP